MRYLTLAEAMVVAEFVTGIDAGTLARSSRIHLLDLALHAPQAGFGDRDLYPDVVAKAAVLVVRIVRNHPLPDGNKRLGWMSLAMFLAMNGFTLEVGVGEAVEAMLAIAGGKWDEPRTERWLRGRVLAEGRADDR